MTEFEHEEHVTRLQAAQRLVDIAYALTAGNALELRQEGTQLSVPVADEVRLVRRTTFSHGEIEVDVMLSWSAPTASEPDHTKHAMTRPSGPPQA